LFLFGKDNNLNNRGGERIILNKMNMGNNNSENIGKQIDFDEMLFEGLTIPKTIFS
jgi:hypothetical protein